MKELPAPFPLQKYLARIGFDGEAMANVETLQALHRCQVFTLPFENLSAWTGIPVRVDQQSLLEKMIFPVSGGRGGYCFELNQLFLLALQSIGFKTRSLCARVWRGSFYGPRSHQITLVEAGGKKWLADVGFGGNGLIDPLPFATGLEFDQGLDHYRILEDADFGYRLENRIHAEWRTLYAFSLDPFLEQDYQALNFFVSTSPDSLFTRIPMCIRPTQEARYILYGDVFRIRGGSQSQTRKISTSAELRSILEEHFGMEWPEHPGLPDPVPPPPDARPVD